MRSARDALGAVFMMQHYMSTLNHGALEAPPRKWDRRVLDAVPEADGLRVATPRGGAIYSFRQPGSQILESEIHLAAVDLAPAPGNRAALGSDRMQQYDAPVGTLAILPTNVEARAVWSEPRESLIVAIKPESLRELAALELDAGQVSLRPPAFGTVDPQALRIAELLKVELTRPELPNELYVDSLVIAFSVHLLRNYSGTKKHTPIQKSGLSARDAKRVQEFLNENFSRKLRVVELAELVGLSPSHFIRAFSKTFGQPPHQYVLNLRLNFAERMLVEGNIKIAEVAYLSGFSSQSHLTVAMRTSRHITPAEIRRGR